MNLHGIVSGAIGVINPNTQATIQFSTGSTTGADGTRTPAYAGAVTVTAQVQALTTDDTYQLDSLVVAKSTHTVYLNGPLAALVRMSAQGGDIVTLSDGRVYLTTAILEQWPDWTKATVTLQNGS